MTRPGWPYPRSPWERRDDARALLEDEPDRLAGVLLAVVQVLARGCMTSQRKLRAAVREELGCCSDGDVDAAVELLDAYVQRTTGTRGATHYTLEVDRLPSELRHHLSPEVSRNAVTPQSRHGRSARTR